MSKCDITKVTMILVVWCRKWQWNYIKNVNEK